MWQLWQAWFDWCQRIGADVFIMPNELAICGMQSRQFCHFFIGREKSLSVRLSRVGKNEILKEKMLIRSYSCSKFHQLTEEDGEKWSFSCSNYTLKCRWAWNSALEAIHAKSLRKFWDFWNVDFLFAKRQIILGCCCSVEITWPRDCIGLEFSTSRGLWLLQQAITRPLNSACFWLIESNND